MDAVWKLLCVEALYTGSAYAFNQTVQRYPVDKSQC